MAEVVCRRCGERRAGLEQAPLPGKWGSAVLDGTCADCWSAWKEEQTRLINHLGLRPHLPEDRAKLYSHLSEFLKLQPG